LLTSKLFEINIIEVFHGDNRFVSDSLN